MGEKTNPRLKKLLIVVVEKQLRENNPPITKMCIRDRIKHISQKPSVCT